MEKDIKINSCADVDRGLLEEYLVHINTNGSSGRGNSDDILKLRAVLESVGKLYGYSHLESLFINTDIPPEVQPVFRSYSDAGTDAAERSYHKTGYPVGTMYGHPPNAWYENMNKYDRMIEMNRERSDEKIAAAKLAIRKLLDQGERVSVPQLVKMTGASKRFFYKNPIVRAEIDRAMEQQAGTINPRRGILDKAMEGRMDLPPGRNFPAPAGKSGAPC